MTDLLVLADARNEIANYLSAVITVYVILIIAYILSSLFFSFGGRVPYSRWSSAILGFLRDVCEPYLGLFRRFIPPLGPLDLSPIVAIVVAGALAALLTYFAFNARRPLAWLPTGLLVGGAVGNIIDRIRLGAVTDFLKLPSWPAFNIADAAITVGVVLLVIVVERGDRLRRPVLLARLQPRRRGDRDRGVRGPLRGRGAA